MNSVNRVMVLTASLALGATAFAGDKTVGEVVDDAWILAKAEAALVGYDASNINIEVHDGTVQLAGFVKSDDIERAALEAVREVKGVKAVHDQLHVHTQARQPGEWVDDGVVAARVKTGLGESDATDALDINVEVREGVVLLSGFVDSAQQATAAVDIAKGTEGVSDVINGMEVPPS